MTTTINEARDLSAARTGPLRPSKLAHVVIRTANFAAAKTWWAKVLNAHPTFENEQLAFMTYDDEHHRIGIINMPHLGEQDQGRSGVEHISFTYRDLGELLANYRRLKGEGVEPFWTINHGPTISLYYRDPDGTKVELQHDVFDDAGVEAFFASGAYEENFMGIVFDPEEMIADYESGRPLNEITERPRLPIGMTPWDMHRP